jgi:hypothetical protein
VAASAAPHPTQPRATESEDAGARRVWAPWNKVLWPHACLLRLLLRLLLLLLLLLLGLL